MPLVASVTECCPGWWRWVGLFVLGMLAVAGMPDNALGAPDGCRMGMEDPPRRPGGAAMPTGTLTYSETNLIMSMNPYKVKVPRGESERMFSLIYEGLVRWDYEAERMMPVLATTCSLSPDQRSLTFHLRTDTRWHDGAPFTADDVVFTYNFARSPATESDAVRESFAFIDRIEAPDPHTVVFHFVRPSPDAIFVFDTWIIPAHLFQNNLERRGNELSRKPIGTGPYKLVTKGLGTVELAVNEDYHGQVGYLQRAVMQHELDPTRLADGLLTGDTDLIISVPTRDISKLGRQQAQIRLEPYQSFSFDAFAYNLRHSVLSDTQVRRAMTMGLDREHLLVQNYYGKGQVIGGPFVPNTHYYDQDLTPLPYDPDQARRLLNEAGYVDSDGDGVRERGGRPLQFRLVTLVENVAASTKNAEVAASFADAMAGLGIEIEIVHLNVDQYTIALFEAGDFDIAWIKWVFDPTYDITRLFTQSGISKGGYNFIHYQNAEVEEIVAKFRQAEEAGERIDLMQAVQRMIRDEVPYTFLYTVDAYAAYNRRFRLRIDPYYFFSFFNEWYVRGR